MRFHIHIEELNEQYRQEIRRLQEVRQRQIKEEEEIQKRKVRFNVVLLGSLSLIPRSRKRSNVLRRVFVK